MPEDRPSLPRAPGSPTASASRSATHAQKRRARGPFAAIWATLAVFLVLLAVLAARLSAGQDPGLLALKAKTLPPPRHVLVKRIYERVVVVHLPPEVPAPGPSSSQQVSSSGGAFSSGSLVTRTS